MLRYRQWARGAGRGGGSGGGGGGGLVETLGEEVKEHPSAFCTVASTALGTEQCFLWHWVTQRRASGFQQSCPTPPMTPTCSSQSLPPATVPHHYLSVPTCSAQSLPPAILPRHYLSVPTCSSQFLPPAILPRHYLSVPCTGPRQR